MCACKLASLPKQAVCSLRIKPLACHVMWTLKWTLNDNPPCQNLQVHHNRSHRQRHSTSILCKTAYKRIMVCQAG